MEWVQTERRRWDVNGRAVGFWKQVGRLSNVVLRNVGHMAPHDNPLVGQVRRQKGWGSRLRASVGGWCAGGRRLCNTAQHCVAVRVHTGRGV